MRSEGLSFVTLMLGNLVNAAEVAKAVCVKGASAALSIGLKELKSIGTLDARACALCDEAPCA